MLLWPFNKYPGTDYETFNWEWILHTVKTYTQKVDDFIKDITDTWNDFRDNINDTWNDFKNWTTGEINQMHDDFAKYVSVTEGALNAGAIANGAITKPKIDADFLTEIENSYVTPEMYGAVGDGVADDTAAVQAAFDDGRKHIVLANKYKVTSPITAPANHTLIDGGGLVDAGNGTAFTFDGIEHIVMKDLQIFAGIYGIHITSTSRYSNYNYFSDLFIQGTDSANSKGIYVETTSNYINEQIYNNVICWHYEVAFYIKGDGTHECNDHKFIGCSGETSTRAGFELENSDQFRAIACRHQETGSLKFITHGTCRHFTVIGGLVINTVNGAQELSANTNGIILGSYRSSDMYNESPGQIIYIVNGVFIPATQTLAREKLAVNVDTTLPVNETSVPVDLAFASANAVNVTLDPRYYGGRGKINEVYIRKGGYTGIYTIKWNNVDFTLPAISNADYKHIVLKYVNTGSAAGWVAVEAKAEIASW